MFEGEGTLATIYWPGARLAGGVVVFLAAWKMLKVHIPGSSRTGERVPEAGGWLWNPVR